MSDFYADGLVVPLSVASAHGPLRGELALLPGANGIVVLARVDSGAHLDDTQLTALLREAGLSTLNVGLISRQEEHFADVGNNVPLLAKRLLDFLGLLKNRMQLGSLPHQPFGVFAVGAAAPVAVRAAALRDHDITALVCHGGLIDRAGMLYLRSLESALLMLVDAGDAHEVACSRRALQEVAAVSELRLIEPGASAAPNDSQAAQAAAQWFVERLRPAPAA